MKLVVGRAAIFCIACFASPQAFPRANLVPRPSPIATIEPFVERYLTVPLGDLDLPLPLALEKSIHRKSEGERSYVGTELFEVTLKTLGEDGQAYVVKRFQGDLQALAWACDAQKLADRIRNAPYGNDVRLRDFEFVDHTENKASLFRIQRFRNGTHQVTLGLYSASRRHCYSVDFILYDAESVTPTRIESGLRSILRPIENALRTASGKPTI